jgi:1-pyrroline-5-carboxylate dehydrogenase
VNACIDTALKAKPAWEAMSFEDRASIFLRACHLITDKYRYDLMAATILGQGKNIWQAEIDSSVESVDFFQQYIKACEDLFSQQPTIHEKGSWNRL